MDISKTRSSDNYESVQMDMSEESNNNISSDDSDNGRSNICSVSSSVPILHQESSNKITYSDKMRSDSNDRSSSSRDCARSAKKHPGSGKLSNKHHRSLHTDKLGSKDSKEGKKSLNQDCVVLSKELDKKRCEDKRKHHRDLSKNHVQNDEKEKLDRNYRHHDRNDLKDIEDKKKSKDRGVNRDRYRKRERDRDRHRFKTEKLYMRHTSDDHFNYRKERDFVRSKSRSRSCSRSRSRSISRSKSREHKTRTRSRSKSKDGAQLQSKTKDSGAPYRSISYREEKGRSKLAQLEKLGIELRTPETDAEHNCNKEQSYYNPLTTATQGKYAEQIQKRKLLWANKPKEESKSTVVPSSTNTWMGTTFTHDQDGKVTAKFKRLMGIKDDVAVPANSSPKPDILKKQEEMFNHMEQQYEVARATTHTQRGVGLGYATSGFQFPR